MKVALLPSIVALASGAVHSARRAGDPGHGRRLAVGYLFALAAGALLEILSFVVMSQTESDPDPIFVLVVLPLVLVALVVGLFRIGYLLPGRSHRRVPPGSGGGRVAGRRSV